MTISIKKQLCNVMKDMYNKQFISLYDGNVSFYKGGSNSFYITQGSVKKNNLNSNHIIDVPFSKSLDTIPNVSRESLFHKLIICQHRELNHLQDVVVLHSHPIYTTSFMGLERNKCQLNMLYHYFPELKQRVHIGKNVSHTCLPGTLSLAEDISKNILNHDMVGLENHGIVCVGESVEEVWDKTQIIEYHAKMFGVQN
jgi:L-fuculose-phosphate aldolase